jgi:hypothetical protein
MLNGSTNYGDVMSSIIAFLLSNSFVYFIFFINSLFYGFNSSLQICSLQWRDAVLNLLAEASLVFLALLLIVEFSSCRLRLLCGKASIMVIERRKLVHISG